MNFEIEWQYIHEMHPDLYRVYVKCNQREKSYMAEEIRLQRNRPEAFRGSKPAIGIYAKIVYSRNSAIWGDDEPWLLGAALFSRHTFAVYVKSRWRGTGIGTALLDKAWELDQELGYNIDPREMKLQA